MFFFQFLFFIYVFIILLLLLCALSLFTIDCIISACGWARVFVLFDWAVGIVGRVHRGARATVFFFSFAALSDCDCDCDCECARIACSFFFRVLFIIYLRHSIVDVRF